MTDAQLTIKPKRLTKMLLAPLSERARYVVINRFGLGEDAHRRTLESIGEEYGITRERVRQIENFALAAIKKADAYKEASAAFDELAQVIRSLGGGVVADHDLYEHIAKNDEGTKNHAMFLLTVGEAFERAKEDDHFKPRWVVNKELSENVHKALHKIHGALSEEDLVAETELLSLFKKHLKDHDSAALADDDVLRRWLNLSNIIGRNTLGEWGLAVSPNIHARGIRDYAYLVIRKHGSPLHFTEVARLIEETFEKTAHVATCHNELIKDKERFALVGRGTYALTSWGYTNGVVRDVIMEILKKYGPLQKDALIKNVLKERYVKENTILVNLQNKRHFRKSSDGAYTLA